MRPGPGLAQPVQYDREQYDTDSGRESLAGIGDLQGVKYFASKSSTADQWRDIMTA